MTLTTDEKNRSIYITDLPTSVFERLHLLENHETCLVCAIALLRKITNKINEHKKAH